MLNANAIAVNRNSIPKTWPFNTKTISLVRYPKVIPDTKLKHFGITLFELRLFSVEEKL